MAAPTDDQLQQARVVALRVASRYLGRDSGLAEDVAQEVLLKLLDTDVGALRDWQAWVNRVARNRALDIVRWDQRHGHDIVGQDFDVSAPPRQWRVMGGSQAAMWPEVLAVLTATLTDKEREMLLASIDGASNAEIADDFGYGSANSAAVTLSRIRAKVRRDLPEPQIRQLLAEQRLY